MSDIETTKIEDGAFAADKVFSATALADTGPTTSEEFLFAQTLGMAELQIKASGAVATGVGETLVITVVTADESGGTFDDTVFTYTVPASTTIADGEVIAAYVAPSGIEECYTKAVVTSDFDASGLAVDGVVIPV